MVKFNKILSKGRLKEILGRFKEQNILVIGDLMLDRFIYGKVERISPEAPVPVVEWQNEKSFPGGAGNVACNISSLGGRCSVAGLIGEDEPGDRLVKLLKENGVETKFIFRKRGISTTEKIRIVSKAQHQQLLRLDKETRNSYYLKEVISFLKEKRDDFSAFLFSDYGKGVINQTFLSKSLPILSGRIVTVDPKVEHFSLYKGVTSITPNRHEAAFGLKEMVPTTQKGVEELGRKIMKALRPKSLIITQGEEGMTIFEPVPKGDPFGVTSYHISTAAKEVFDVTGAGDTVIASLTLSLASGSSFIEAGTISTLSAGVVVGKRGVATVTPEEIL